MPLRPMTDFEAREVIYASLSPIWVFRFTPMSPRFLAEIIAWADILEIPPVTKTWLYSQTLVAAYLHDRRFHHPRLNRKVFFAHLAATGDGGETVADYRDFLSRELILREPT